MKDLEEYCPNNRQEWRQWLKENHKTKKAVWLIFNKTKSPNYNLNWHDAVDEALCYGWIDGIKKSIDEDCYKHYFSKRKPKSNWSKVNKEKIEQLIAQGLMEEAGYQSIAIAKENGSWTILDAIEALEVPLDLQDAFSNNKAAWDFYENLSDSLKKQYLYWVISAKKEETRLKRISEIIENGNQGLRPKPFR